MYSVKYRDQKEIEYITQSIMTTEREWQGLKMNNHVIREIGPLVESNLENRAMTQLTLLVKKSPGIEVVGIKMAFCDLFESYIYL